MIVTLVNFSKSKRKDLGAFYTPMPYAKKAAELVQMAVKRVPKENDYIILDRCAGTGNLEAALIGLKDDNGDDLISHCVVSTYEYYEYKVLQERIGGDVREIIPPTEANVVYENGRVANADAMSEDFINNPIIKQYIDNPKCSVILFENPPYQDSSSISYIDDNGYRPKTGRKENYVTQQYVSAMDKFRESKGSFREITNLFIWSGFKYYLRHDTDSYILFSPCKYFKTIGLTDSVTFEKGYIFNRKHFHASPSIISCIYWSNAEVAFVENGHKLEVIDICDSVCVSKGSLSVKKVNTTFLEYFDRRKFQTDTEDGVYLGRDGEEDIKHKKYGKSLYNENIIGYLRTIGYSTDAMNSILIRGTYFGARGFYLRNDNYLEKLPLFAAKKYPQDLWYNKDIYYTTADGGDAYTKDKNFLKSCLIYTCLSNQNKCLSFDGSDGRRYQNELCFDNNALALRDLKKYQADKITALDDEEKDLLKTWDKIIFEARETKNYNPEFNYGIYQITKELNTFTVTGSGKNKKRNYDYIDLNSDLITLRSKLKQYYQTHITQKMFKYELLK